MTSRAGEQSGARTASKVAAWVLGIGAAFIPVMAIIGVVAFVFTYVTVTVPGPVAVSAQAEHYRGGGAGPQHSGGDQ